MKTTRLEAFSDAVIAIIITIMVLELRPPEGYGFLDLGPVVPRFLGYVLSFVYLAIYWNNHHHLVSTCERVSGPILWANLHLLFWLSLIPFVTTWMSEHRGASAPIALYGVVLLMAAIAYWVLQRTIIGVQGGDSRLRKAIGRDWKGTFSPVLYLIAIGLAFVIPPLSLAIYAAVALIWLVPDRRIERMAA